MSLKTTPVSRCLDKKLVLWGFEVFDLLAIFILLSILNLFFGQSDLKLVLVWAPTIILTLILKYGKRGRPEGHLLHWARFQMRPGVLLAFKEPLDTPPPYKMRQAS